MSGPLSVLLVDDDDAFCTLVRIVIQQDAKLSAGIRLSRLRDGVELLDHLAAEDVSTRPAADLILMDERMPRLDGTEALAQLAAEKRMPTTPICMLSTSDQQDLVRRAYSLGANFYFVKPATLDGLRTALFDIHHFFTMVAELPS